MADQEYKVKDLDGNIRIIRGPAGASNDEIIAQAKTLFAPPPPAAESKESDSMRDGRKANVVAQGVMNALQGTTMGFGDEIAGGAAKLFGGEYEPARDYVRGATEQFKTDHPKTALATEVAGALPTMFIPGMGLARGAKVAGEAAKVATTGQKIANAMRVGGTQGALSGVGNSTETDAMGMAGDAVKGGATGAAFGVGGQGGASALGGVASNVAERFVPKLADDAARMKLAQVLERGAPEGVIPTKRASARLDRYGDEATIADVGGEAPKTLLDTLATMPGKAKDAVEKLIRARQAGRSGRIMDAADDALGTNGQGYAATQAMFDTAKKAADPFYKQLEGVSVPIDAELQGLLQATEKAHGGAELLSKLRQEGNVDLSKLKAGGEVSIDALDKVKQSLYDLGEEAKRAGNKTLSGAYNDARKSLIKKMDAISPKDASGNSIYKQARETFAGPAQLQDALTSGRDVMKQDALSVAEAVKDLTQGELDAFRIGALQSIRDKVGTEAGQTSILKMWKEPATSDKLRELFGDDYRKFSVAVAKEARLKDLEKVGRGSQTASRNAAAADLDIEPAKDALNVATSVATVKPVEAASSAAKLWNRVETPEATRNALAKMLMLKGPKAKQELSNIDALVKALNQRAAKEAAFNGTFAGQSAN